MEKLKHEGSCDSVHQGKTHEVWEDEQRNMEDGKEVKR